MKNQKMKFVKVFGVFILLGMLLLGCNASDPPNRTGLQIYSMSTALGAVDNNMDKQRLSYSFMITNEENRDIHVESIKPLLGDGIADRVITEDLIIIVEKSIPANQSLEINDEIILNTEGLSKIEIIDLEPFVTGIKISSEQIIELPGQQ